MPLRAPGRGAGSHSVAAGQGLSHGTSVKKQSPAGEDTPEVQSHSHGNVLRLCCAVLYQDQGRAGHRISHSLG